jgi:cation transport regulator ChaB
MPFKSTEDLTKRVRGTGKLSERKKRQFIHVFNQCFDKDGDDPSCYAKAWGAVNNTASDKGVSRMNKVANELVKIAKELDGGGSRELRILTMEDVMADTPMLKLKVVFKDTLEEVNAWAKKGGLEWKPSRREMFGGYWYDKQSSEAFIIT